MKILISLLPHFIAKLFLREKQSEQKVDTKLFASVEKSDKYHSDRFEVFKKKSL